MVWENSQNGIMWITNSSKILKLGKITFKIDVTSKYKVRDDNEEKMTYMDEFNKQEFTVGQRKIE
jgi:hypothetical protein